MLIYLLTNRANGKCYVGQTSQPLATRLRQHVSDAKRRSTPIQCAIRKYGIETFDVQIIATASGQEELNLLEALWILVLRSFSHEAGYNCRMGGNHQPVNLETRIKMSNSAKRKVLSAEHRKNIGDAHRGRRRSPAACAAIKRGAQGRRLSDEAMRKSREALRGSRPWNFGTKGMIVAWNKGVPATPEQRVHLSAVRRGVPMSQEQRAKISASLKGRMPAINLREKRPHAADGRFVAAQQGGK